MERPQLSWLQKMELSLLAHVQSVAIEHGLVYYLAYGSALGAVRERGMIPWDWDIDLHIPSRTYDALIRALEESLPPEAEVITPERDPRFEAMFARVALKGVHHTFLHVDLFPLAPAPTRRWHRVHLMVNRVLCRAHSMKRLQLANRSHLRRSKRAVILISKVLLAPVPARALRQTHLKWNSSTKGAFWLCNPTGTYGLREYFPSKYFEGHTTFAFGTLADVRVPAQWRDYLTQLYGPEFMDPISGAAQEKALAFFDDHVAPRLPPIRA